MSTVRELEITRLRAMSATDKLATMQALWRQAWALTAAGVRGRQPAWTTEQIEAEVRRIFRREPA